MAYKKKEKKFDYYKGKFQRKKGDTTNYYKSIQNLKQCDNLSATLDTIKDFVGDETKIISSTQIRNIYSDVLKIESFNDLQMLRPKLAYIVGRNSNAKEVISFLDVFISDTSINSAGSEKETVDNFKTFMEAIVSYHKYHFGETNK